MPLHDELTVLTRSARQLAKLCRDGAALVVEARDANAPPAVIRRQEDVTPTCSGRSTRPRTVAFELDCSRCGRRVQWVPGEGCELGHWAHAEPAPDDHAPRLRS